MTLYDSLIAEYRTDTGLSVENPANGDHLFTVKNYSVAEVENAIENADIAFKKWSTLTGKARAAILRTWYDLIIENQHALAALITAECGKPLTEANGEVLYGASFVEWFAEEAKRLYGDIVPHHADGKRIMVLKQPIGVISAITPWNFPVAMITRKVAPALAAGCSAVIKPAEATPLSALALEKLAIKAGIPEGVFKIVTTTDPVEIGKVLTTHPTVRKISFTGSTAVGKLLMAQSADTVKKVSMELGGNAPFIVFEDADIEAAVAGALISKYRNAGQTCVCANRFYVHENIYDNFIEKFTAAVADFTVGDGADEGTVVGPLINEAAINKVEELVENAVADGATVALGGKRHTIGGNFYEPTLLTNIDHTNSITQAEIFGPVAPIFKFKTEDDVICMANDTPYGLAAYFYTKDMGRMFRVMEALEYGMVGVNEGVVSTEVAPFGGVKESGIGREGSRYGIDEYTEIKYSLIGGI
ncbi:NAD-dependent succinate-semialdehyde dehydrogenase [Kordiimonas sp. SCSIO 12603]|uniref:NAD-dependent succinate-semialdehyde dehydrogenase n=1 Tax=Kordiimonas sp. SCSIO 12603 TaxID=2829596 RepID=UPI00210513B4|nr:NAD-dependent succinate-semialdehyde dehydrogenase [Kordiimonas sp. SCSIO 12603]UTW60205.1 NAD-dependent succinate-semialdehyde dehydrogenase [Kordiimonas sp. SCSIO 12603]